MDLFNFKITWRYIFIIANKLNSNWYTEKNALIEGRTYMAMSPTSHLFRMWYTSRTHRGYDRSVCDAFYYSSFDTCIKQNRKIEHRKLKNMQLLPRKGTKEVLVGRDISIITPCCLKCVKTGMHNFFNQKMMC